MAKRKLYIVEDEALVARHLEEYLVQENFEVLGVADSAETAFYEILETRPELLLLDIRLGNGEDGLRLAELVQARMNVPVIFISGRSDSNTLQRVKKIPSCFFLLKPIVEEQLKIAIEMALLKYQQEEINQYRQELEKITYSLSHTFRGPVASILGVTNLCKLEVKDPQALFFNELIEKNVRKIDKLLVNYFRYSELSQWGEVKVERVQWEQLWKELFAELSFREENDGKLPLVDSLISVPFYSNIALLKTILLPVLKNTLDFRRRQIAHVSILCREYKEGVRIKILDKGIGMSKDSLSKSMELFYRGTEKTGGNGFGLSLSRKAVRVLGGNIKIISKENKGTCVVVYIPGAIGNSALLN